MVTNYYPSENIENMNIGNKFQSLKIRVASLISRVPHPWSMGHESHTAVQ